MGLMVKLKSKSGSPVIIAGLEISGDIVAVSDEQWAKMKTPAAEALLDIEVPAPPAAPKAKK